MNTGDHLTAALAKVRQLREERWDAEWQAHERGATPEISNFDREKLLAAFEAALLKK